jgi:hypothetical protein
MRGTASAAIWLVVAACSFDSQQAPTDSRALGSDAGTTMMMGSGSGSGSSGSGSSGSGSGSGSNTWPCGTKPTDPGANRGELITGHGGWGTQNLQIGGVDTRLAIITAGNAVALNFSYDVAELCPHNDTCALQLQLGTNDGKDGCVFDGTAVGNGINVAMHDGNAAVDMVFGSAGSYEIVVDPAASTTGCGSSWTNGQPSDSNEIIAYVCVTP